MCGARYGSEAVALCLNSLLLLRRKELLQVEEAVGGGRGGHGRGVRGWL